MNRILIFLYLLLACIINMNLQAAVDLKEKPDAKTDLRILELLPNLVCPLAVEPGIPVDFIASSPDGTLDPYDWIYWGPKDVLKEYFKDQTSLKTPILRVKLSANVAQTGPKSFNAEETIQLMKKKDPKGFDFIETQWGDYPILAIRTKIDGMVVFLAWVGLNDPDAGWTLMFNLVNPNKKGRPNRKDRELWQSLMMKTTQLKDGDYFKACGQDLQEGYTIVNIGGAKLKMLAEKRQRDNVMQIVVIPENSDIEFHYIDMMECLMGATWKYGEPIVKIFGEVVLTDKNFTSITNNITTIFFKTVPEFSFKKEEGKKSLIFQKTFEKIDEMALEKGLG